MKMRSDALENTLRIFKSHPIFKTQDGESLLHEEVISPLIIALRILMECSVELNDELQWNTEEIDDEITKGNLPTKLEPVEFPILEL